MSLTPGTRLGPYEIVAPLGAGGMGEVYRAKDTRLGRDVAVKVLPQHLSANEEVRARFEREAKTVSSLNHPNICTLFDVGREGGTDFLVMELIDGETLAQRLTKGALPISDLLRIGAQIADALDRAHRAGVIHRDLKPGNVMLTKAGAKLMDFGLARATGMAGTGGASGVTALAHSPTIAQPLTAEGTLVGTFQYMAPEQLEGAEADARSDVWALGCVLYEMATGRRAFAGKSQASLISSIMSAAPAAISTLAPTNPPALDRLLQACLHKDPDERVQTAHDVKLQLDWIRDAGPQSGTHPAVPVTSRRPRRERVAWIVAAAGLLSAAATLAILVSRPQEAETIYASIPSPAGTLLSPYWSDLALSPDGRTVAFLTGDSTGSALWVRPLGSETARRLPEAQNPGVIFWTYDSRSVAYFGNGKLYKVAVDGGAPVTICNAPVGRGGTCNRDGVIVFAPATGGPLLRVSSGGGGEPTPVTALDAARHEAAHRFPCFLPDGDHFLFVALPAGPDGWDTFVGSLRSKSVQKILTAGSAAVYAEPGYLVFARDGRVMAQRFDAGRLELEGDAVAIGGMPEYSDTDAEPVASASRNGRLAVLQSELPRAKLQWIDRTGAALGAVGLPPGPWVMKELSPDARRAAVMKGTDLWLVDLERAMPTRFAPTQSTEASVAWSPDGSRIAYVSKQTGRAEVYVARADGSGTPELVPTTDAQFKYVNDWSPDSQFLVIQTVDPSSLGDLWLIPMSGSGKPEPYLKTAYQELDGRISPDGRWLTYVSNESGESEIYVQSFPHPGHKVRVTRDGGGFANWARGGKEIRYAQGSVLMAVPVEAGVDLRPGTPRPLFTAPDGVSGADATADGERILLSVVNETPRREVRLFINWLAAVAR